MNPPRITRTGDTWRAHDAAGRALAEMALDADGDVVFRVADEVPDGPLLDAMRRALQHAVGEERMERAAKAAAGELEVGNG